MLPATINEGQMDEYLLLVFPLGEFRLALALLQHSDKYFIASPGDSCCLL